MLPSITLSFASINFVHKNVNGAIVNFANIEYLQKMCNKIWGNKGSKYFAIYLFVYVIVLRYIPVYVIVFAVLNTFSVRVHFLSRMY